MLPKSEIENIIHNDFIKVFKKDRIYKYANFDDALNKILLEQILKFSDPTTYNDPFDCNERLLHIECPDKLLNDTISDLSMTLSRKNRRELKRKFQNPINQASIMKKKRSEYKLSCFSESSNDVLMWSHYADKHTGICIGFNFPHQYDDKFILCPVKYIEELKNLDGETDVTRVVLYWLTTKSICWKYEQEIRAITKSKTTEKHETINFDPKFIKEIIFGCNVSDQKINDSLVKLKKCNLLYDEITIKRMEINENNFLLKEILIKPTVSVSCL